MWLVKALICVNVGLIVAIYVPSNTKKPLSNIGVKTIGWQAQSGERNVIIHQNYSNVKLQQHADTKNLDQIYEDNRSGRYLPSTDQQQIPEDTQQSINGFPDEPPTTSNKHTCVGVNCESVDSCKGSHCKSTSTNFDQSQYEQNFDQVAAGSKPFGTYPGEDVDQRVECAGSQCKQQKDNLDQQTGSFPQENNYGNHHNSFNNEKHNQQTTYSNNLGQQSGNLEGNRNIDQQTGNFPQENHYGKQHNSYNKQNFPNHNHFGHHHNFQQETENLDQQTGGFPQQNNFGQQHGNYGKFSQHNNFGQHSTTPHHMDNSNQCNGHNCGSQTTKRCRGDDCDDTTATTVPYESHQKYQRPQNYYSGKLQAASKPAIVYSKCPPGETGQFVYEFSCNQFLNCWKGRGYPQNCAPGTLFNPKTLECDYADKVECVSGPRRAQQKPVSAKLQAGCPAEFSGIMPHYGDCSKFINCANGVENIMDCPPGTLFDVKSNLCDFPHKTSCVNGGNEIGKLHGGIVYASSGTQNIHGSGDKLVGSVGYNKDTTLSNQYGNNYDSFHGTTVPMPTSHVVNSNRPTTTSQYSPSYLEQSGYNQRHSNRPEAGTVDQLHGSYSNYNQNYDSRTTGVYSGTVDQLHGSSSTYNQNYNSENSAVHSERPFGGGTTSTSYYHQQPSSPENAASHSSVYGGRTNYDSTAGYYAGGTTYHSQPNRHGNSGSYSQSNSFNGNTGSTSVHRTDGINNYFESTTGYNRGQTRYHQQYFPTHTQAGSYDHSVVGATTPTHSSSPIGFHSSHGVGQNATQKAAYTKQSTPKCPGTHTGLLPHPYVCSKFLNCANGRTYIQDCAPGTLFNSLGGICDFPYNVRCSNYVQPQHYEVLDTTTEYHTQGPQVTSATTKQPLVDLNTAQSNSKNKHWPPPFPSTDLNADYVFEYEDINVSGEAEMIASPQVKNWCDAKGFECGNKVCVAPHKVCDGMKNCPNGVDEVNCDNNLAQFDRTPNTKLAVRETEKIFNITLKWCAKICLERDCRAFNYRPHDGVCFILSSNVGLSGALIILPTYDYYECRAHTVDCSQGYLCRNRKCLMKTQVCDGANDCGDGMDERGCDANLFGYAIKLEGTSQKNSGRLVVDAFGKTGFICDDMFGLRNADVACRELGFPLGALEVKGNSYFAKDIQENNTFYMMDDVSCLGNETTLRDCDFGGWGIHNCKAQEIVGVVCKTPLEECPKDHWQCNTGNECLQRAFLCDGVFDCTDTSDEDPTVCNSAEEFRLVDGPTQYEGRLEVKHYGIWGTVCDDDFNDDAAKVACKQMGYQGAAAVRKDSFYGEGSGPIWLDQVFCGGNETSLLECSHWEFGEHNCEHNEDVGIVCSDHNTAGKPRNINLEEEFEDVSLPAECGFRSDAIFREKSDVHFRVVEGSVATQGEYPWQASIRIKGKARNSHWCGAVVISEKFVLTAAHCLVGFSKGAYFVVAGDYNVDNLEGTEQEAYIDDFIIHEEFRSGNKMNNDIALVRLKGRGFRLTKDVQPICLPDNEMDYMQGLNCTISGFGSIENGKSKASHDLRAGWIPIQSTEVCKMPHVYGAAITPGMMCAGFLKEGVDACDGDSGGPLACLHNGVFTLFGITSWGQHCGYANKPGVYVRVSHYRNWIEETMKKLAK